MATVQATPMGAPVPDVTVKSVTSDTSVDEAAGLTVTVTMSVPAGYEGGGRQGGAHRVEDGLRDVPDR